MRITSSRKTNRYGLAAIAAAASLAYLLPNAAHALPAPLAPEVRLADGVIEGVRMRGEHKDVRVFRGIPYAAAPVGDLRFREPQPVARWAGARSARQFGPRCMQSPAPKQEFRSKEMNEDCLYLNVWTPARGEGEKLPVLVYFHGDKFANGDGSESRYDGANLAKRGVVTVTANYRLGVFGFLALPEAARESAHGTAGNYGLLDQVAALRWVRDNIAQFGGDPSQVTIAGNSAGSISVNAHMASPLSRGLFARAIGESGGAFGSNAMWRREQAEQAATQFATRVGATSLQQLRAMPARLMLAASTQPKLAPAFTTYWPHVDGYFLTDTPEQVFSTGAQAQVPLLLGSNSQEAQFADVVRDATPAVVQDFRRIAKFADLSPYVPPTPENWRQIVQTAFKEHAEEVLAHYPGNDNDEVRHAGNALAGDLSIGYSTWRWMNLHRETGQAPVYFYRFTHIRPPEVNASVKPAQAPQPVIGAVHNAQVEYSLDNLKNQRRYAWTATDYDVSRIFSGYIEQFVKNGNPNGGAPVSESVSEDGTAQPGAGGVPSWPAVRVDNRGMLQQVIGENTHAVWSREAPRQGLIQRVLESRGVNGPAIPLSQ